MDKKQIFGGLLGVGLLMMLIRSFASKIENNISYKYSNPSVDFGLNSKINLDLEITNNNNIGVEVLGFEGDLYYGVKDLGNVSSGSFMLGAGETNGTTVITELRLLDVANNILQLIQDGDYLNELKVKGIIRLKHPKTGVTVSVPYNERVI